MHSDFSYLLSKNSIKSNFPVYLELQQNPNLVPVITAT